MANVLFIDSDPLALKAFRGIIERSVHKFAFATTANEAWEVITRGVFHHLIILEIKLADGNGRAFLASLRKHPYLFLMPVVIYTRAHDRETVRKTLELNVQNYLFKPFEDEKIFSEIRRAMEEPWWKLVMEDEETVAARMGVEVEEVREGRQELLHQLRETLEELRKGWTLKAHGKLGETERLAERWGFDRLGEECKKILELERPNAAQIEEFCRNSEQASRIMKEVLFPGSIMNSDELGNEGGNLEKVKSNFGSGGAPTGRFEDVKKKVEELSGYPVIDSVAASFQMAAANPDIEVETLAEMILNDPCLSVQVYYYVNHVSELSRKTVDGVQDQKHAIQLLGLTRIRAMAKGLVVIPDEDIVRAGFDWKQYRAFQVGCGLIAEQIVGMLTLQINPSVA
ncbi:MAG: response regulator, partial [Chthoniobacterales bacterium]|nr:response regulator [Chthoniobacterales bacterium]